MPDDKLARAAPAHLLTAAEVADRLNISLRTVRRLIKNGMLPIVRIGRLVRIRPEALAALIGKE
jgi:excisionase family DNA binding protein